MGWLMGFIAALIIGLACLAIFAGFEDDKEINRLVKQCVDDGKKEYECKSMFLIRGQTTFIPVVVPVGK